MAHKTLPCIALVAAIAMQTQAHAATLSEVCPSGKVTVVRSFKIKPASSRAQFDAALTSQRAWYKANGYGDSSVYTSTGLVNLSANDSWSLSPDTVITIREHATPIPVSARNAGWYAFTNAISNSAELTYETISCVVENGKYADSDWSKPYDGSNSQQSGQTGTGSTDYSGSKDVSPDTKPSDQTGTSNKDQSSSKDDKKLKDGSQSSSGSSSGSRGKRKGDDD